MRPEDIGQIVRRAWTMRKGRPDRAGAWGWVLWSLSTVLIFSVLVVREPVQPLPIALLITGERPGTGLCATLQWDVGEGFNAFEAKRICLGGAESAVPPRDAPPEGAVEQGEPARPEAQSVSLPQKKLEAFRLISEHGALGLSSVGLTVGGAPRWSMAVDPAASEVVSPPGLATALHQGAWSFRLLLFQTIAAAIGGAALLGAALGTRKARDALRATPLPALIAKHRWFWLIFLLCTAHYLTWVLGQWPGFPTPDVLDEMQQRLRLVFTNLNPLVFTLLMNSIIELTGSLGFVTLAQAVATAALGAYGFAALRRDGCPVWIVLPLGLLFAASPVIAIYNLQPWRDIAFGLLVLWWTLFMFRRGLARHRGASPAPESRGVIVGLGVLLFLVSTVRHNGLVFLGVIPALLVFGKVVRRRAALAVAAIGLAATALVYGPLAVSLGVHHHTDYNRMRFALSANTVIGIMRSPGYRTPSPEADRQIVSAVADFDALERAYNPLSALTLFEVPRKVSPKSPAFNAMVGLGRRLVLDNPNVFLAERTYLFVSTLGFHTWGWASVLGMPGRPQRFLPDSFFDDLSDLRRSPITTVFDHWQNTVLATVPRGPGALDGYVLYFSAFVPFCLLLLSFGLARWLPATAFAAIVPATQAAAIFATAFQTDFRFVYFLYLYGFFALPMMAAEWRHRGSPRSSERLVPARA